MLETTTGGNGSETCQLRVKTSRFMTCTHYAASMTESDAYVPFGHLFCTTRIGPDHVWSAMSIVSWRELGGSWLMRWAPEPTRQGRPAGTTTAEPTGAIHPRPPLISGLFCESERGGGGWRWQLGLVFPNNTSLSFVAEWLPVPS
jgi:hypothetical protein